MALKEGSRFFRPSVAQYTPQFVEEPYPIDELLQEGRRDQEKRDMTMGALGQMSEYLQVNAHPSQEEYKTDLLKGYYGRVDKLAKELGEGANPDQILGALTKINRDWQTDERRRELETGAIQGAAFDTARVQMKARGQFRPWLTNMEETFRQNTQGQFTPIRFEGMEAWINPQPSALQALGSVAKRGDLRNVVDVDPDTGRITSVTKGATGVTPAQLQKASASAADSWLESDAGRQYSIQLIATRPDITDDQILSEATDYIYNLGANQLGMQTREITDIRFAEGAKTAEGAGPPQYERLFEEEGKIPIPINSSDLRKKDVKASAQTGIVSGTGVRMEENIVEQAYPELVGDKKAAYEKIVRAVVPGAKTMDEKVFQEYLKTDEAHEKAAEYIDNLESTIISPSVNVAPFEKEADYNFAKRQIQVYTSGRVFYDMEKGKEIMPDTRKWRLMNKKIQADEFEVQGDLDYKNFVTLRTGNDNFSSSWSMKLVDESGREKQFVVTKKASDLEGQRGTFEKDINKIFRETLQLPGTPSPYEYETQSGKKRTADVTYLPEHEAWEVTLRDPYKDRRISFFTNQLGDIHDRIVLEMQKVNTE